jgi:hypothetical protein
LEIEQQDGDDEDFARESDALIAAHEGVQGEGILDSNIYINIQFIREVGREGMWEEDTI